MLNLKSPMLISIETSNAVLDFIFICIVKIRSWYGVSQVILEVSCSGVTSVSLRPSTEDVLLQMSLGSIRRT